MTTGGGIPIDGLSPAGKATLTIVINQLDALKNFTTLTPDISRCVKKVYGFCLRNGALSGMTANDDY